MTVHQVSKKMLLNSYQNNTDIILYYPHNKSKGIGTLGKIIVFDQSQKETLNVIILGLSRIKLLSMESAVPITKTSVKPSMTYAAEMEFCVAVSRTSVS